MVWPAAPLRRPERFPRILFLDLDGTLLAPGSVLTTRTLAAVRRAAARGTILVIATGGFSFRALTIARALAGTWAGDCASDGAWAITHNGAAVWDTCGDLVLRETMPPAAVDAVLDSVADGVWCAFESATPDGRAAMYYAGRQPVEMDQFVWGPAPPESAPDAAPFAGPGVTGGDRYGWRRWRRVRRTAVRRWTGVLGGWCVGTPWTLRRLDARASAGALLGARYLPWSHRMAEILGRPRLKVEGRDVGPLGATKGRAALWLCERLGVPPADTAAFGDASNDVELMRLAGFSVAMRHATPDVLACANAIAPSNADDGVARVIEDWLDLRN